MKNVFFLISVFTIHFAFATTFIPLSLEKQFEDADGVIKGIYVGKEYRKINDRRIITEATFKLQQSAGIKPSEIINKNNFKVIYPGGKWQGLEYKVSGTPKFYEGEEVLLVLKKTPFGFSVKGLGLGKYIIVKKYENYFYKSSVFPGHDSLGKISQTDLNDSLLRVFGETLKSNTGDKFVYKAKERLVIKKGRMPASLSSRKVASEQLDAKEESTNPIWIIMLFAALGVYSIFSIRKSRK